MGGVRGPRLGLTLLSLALLLTWLYSRLKVCISRRRHWRGDKRKHSERARVLSLINLKASVGGWGGGGVDRHLGSQLPLPLVGAIGRGAAAWAVAHHGALGEVVDVGALVESVLSCLQGGLQLLPQQQVVSGLLHLRRAARFTCTPTTRSLHRLSTEGLRDPCVAQTDLLQQTQLLQLPLMVQNQAVTARSPPSQVLLPSDVRHRGVQHTSTTALHAWGERRKTDDWRDVPFSNISAHLLWLQTHLDSHYPPHGRGWFRRLRWRGCWEWSRMWVSVCFNPWNYKYDTPRRTLYTSRKAGGSPCWTDSWWSERLAALHRGNKTPCRNLWWSPWAGCSSPSS